MVEAIQQNQEAVAADVIDTKVIQNAAVDAVQNAAVDLEWGLGVTDVPYMYVLIIMYVKPSVIEKKKKLKMVMQAWL